MIRLGWTPDRFSTAHPRILAILIGAMAALSVARVVTALVR